MTSLHQIKADAFAALPLLPASWSHGALIDPPYLYAFMGRDFDRQHRLRPESTEAERAAAWNLDWLRELHRVLVPGAYALVFQGARTYHRLAYAAELAGFEVLPMIAGITGKAMAQGGAIGKLIDRKAGAEREKSWRPAAGGTCYEDRGGNPRPWSEQMKKDGGRWVESGPAATPLALDFEGHSTRLRDQLMPIAVLLKPPEGSFARNAARWGVAGVDVDGARTKGNPAVDRISDARFARGRNLATYATAGGTSPGDRIPTKGRHPGNVLLDSAAAEEVGGMSGERPTGGQVLRTDHGNRTVYGGGYGPVDVVGFHPGDSGTAARYFRQFRYIARAPKSERMKGLESWHWVGDPQHPEGWRRVTVEEWQHIPKRRQMIGSNHPTLKPLELTRWAARLILPPMGPEATAIRERTTGSHGRLLVPFSGVLSEAIGAALAGWPEIVAIEYSDSYVAQGASRWRAWGPYSAARSDAIERAGTLQRAEHHEGQQSLFANS